MSLMTQMFILCEAVMGKCILAQIRELLYSNEEAGEESSSEGESSGSSMPAEIKTDALADHQVSIFDLDINSAADDILKALNFDKQLAEENIDS